MVKYISYIALLSFACSLTCHADTIDLSGQWRFALDPQDTGATANWFSHNLPDHIQLPGILQSQGFGDEISVNTPWVAALPRDMRWYLLPQYKAYTKPGNIKIPYLSQPIRHYLGVAWYQRDVNVPHASQGKCVHLTLERARWETTVWLDDKKIGSNNSLVAPHEFELGMIRPGKHQLTIRIDNRMILPYRPDGHSVSDALGGTWNGIVGKIELTSISPVWIDDAQAFPDLAKNVVHIRVAIKNITGQSGEGTLAVENATTRASWTTDGGNAEIDVPVPADTPLWDEFHPNLQDLTLTLKGGAADDQRSLTFGLREVTANDKTLLLNGHEINLRGTHSGGDFPLTGYPATDVESWKHIFQTCKEYGLNHMRFHSWCPPDAAFTAADELGFYIQPECGMWNNFSNPAMADMLEAETARIVKAYGNHPSFLLLSATNEPAGAWPRVLPQWAARWYQKDPRRLYSEDTGRVNLRDKGPTYAVTALRGPRGWFGNDFSAALVNVHIPVISHEVGQWCAYPDFDVIKKFTGYLQPGNYEIFRDSAAAHGVLDRDKHFVWASGRFQVACYKEEIEANLRTAGLSGFQLLDLHDYLGQGTALIGVLDAFWQSKGYVAPEEFRRFCAPTVPLARLKEHIFRTTDHLHASVEIAHFGPEPIKSAHPAWRIVQLDDKLVTHGNFDPLDIPIGKNIHLGDIDADLSQLPAPREYDLVVDLDSIGIENDWHFWLYPADVPTTASSDILITSNWKDAETSLAAGGKVLFTPPASSLDNTSPPLNNVPIFWNRLMNPKLEAMLGLWCNVNHPALSEFPTEAYCDWQWTDIVRGMRAINIEKAPPKLQPIVQAIDDWNRNYKLSVICECTVGPGSLVICAPDVQNDLEHRTVARQLRRSLLDYMASSRFAPKVALTPDQASALWPGPRPTSAPATQPAAMPGDINEGVNSPPAVR
jgi:hypothetical protein